ncbi:MAG: ATP-binding protein [Thermodesulfobacteriota bacterium]
MDGPFCDRDRELKELISHALNKANVVLYSPRRYGKTSLIRRVQKAVKEEGAITVYTDLFGVDSVESLANRIVTCLYSYCHSQEGLLKKAMKFLSIWRPVIKPDPEMGLSITAETTAAKNGIELLDETLGLFGAFMKDHGSGFHVVLDEFQEISELRESRQIEGIMRSHIQTQENASYFFVGSRRRLLLEIFNERKRPFYKSAINYALGPLPKDEAIIFIVSRFKSAGRRCPEETAERIYYRVGGYPYYLQRIPYTMYELGDKKVTDATYEEALQEVVKEEEPYFQTKLEALSVHQKRLLYALSIEPTAAPFVISYMKRHNLASMGGARGALKVLLALDYVERHEDGQYRVVDPLFALYTSPLVQVSMG